MIYPQNFMKIRQSHRPYLIKFLVLLIIEIAIANFGFHPIIRGYVGDILVIPLLWYFAKSIYPFKSIPLLMALTLIAVLVELFQLFSFSPTNKILKIVLGNTFDWLDLLCYGLGALSIYIIIKINSHDLPTLQS